MRPRMPVPISEIVDLAGGRYPGHRDLEVLALATLADARPDKLSFLGNQKYAAQLSTTNAGAVLVTHAMSGDDLRLIRVDDVYFAMAKIVTRWFAERPAPDGIS